MGYIKTYDEFIKEGINISSSNIVTLTDVHNKGVDFRLEVNPTIQYIKQNNYNIKIVSIFKRTQLSIDKSDDDGNPLIYALKSSNGYKLSLSKNNFLKYLIRFLSIFDKEFIDKYQDSTILLSASKSNINKCIYHYLSHRFNNECINNII